MLRVWFMYSLLYSAMSELSNEEKCLRAFERGDHDEAISLLPLVQHHNTIRSYGLYLIHYASRYGWTDIIELLVTQYNCDIDQKDSEDGYTALHEAAACGHTDTALYLINNKCDEYGNSNIIHTMNISTTRNVFYFIDKSYFSRFY